MACDCLNKIERCVHIRGAAFGELRTAVSKKENIL